MKRVFYAEWLSGGDVCVITDKIVYLERCSIDELNPMGAKKYLTRIGMIDRTVAYSTYSVEDIIAHLEMVAK